MSIFGNCAAASKITIICIAALLITSASVIPRPVQAAVVAGMLVTETIIQAIICSLGLFLWQDKDSDRRGHNLNVSLVTCHERMHGR